MKEIRSLLYYFTTTAWVFGICDRSLAAFANGWVDSVEIAQLAIGLFFLFSMILLNPNHTQQ